MSKSKVFLLISGIILIAVGVWSLVEPESTLAAFAIFIGIAALISGISNLCAYFSNTDKIERNGWVLARGIIDSLIGVLLLFNIPATILVLPLVFGLWAIFTGIIYFSQSFSARAAGVKSWWLALVGGILSIIIGILMSTNLLFGFWVITLEIGFFLILFGVAALFSAFGNE